MGDACFDCWAIFVIARCALQVRIDDLDDVFEHYELIREANAFDADDRGQADGK